MEPWRFMQSVSCVKKRADRDSGQSPITSLLFSPTPDLLTAPTPKILWIELTSKCPFDCIFCSRKSRWGSGIHMEFGMVRSLMQELVAPEIVRLNYSGESTTYPYLLEAIDLAASTGATTELVTALSNITPALLKKIAKSPLHRLSVSLHTLEPKQYQEIYRHSSVSQLRQRIQQFLQIQGIRGGKGPHLDFCFVAMSDNLLQLSPIADYARAIGVREIFIHPVIQRHTLPHLFSRELHDNRLTEGFKTDLRETAQKVQLQRPEVALMILNPSLFPTPALESSPRAFASELPAEGRIHTCDQNPWETVHVLANGDVVACEVHDEELLGNLRQRSLREIWHGEAYRRFRRQYLNGEMEKCRQCPWKTAYRPGPWTSSVDLSAGISPQFLGGWFFNEPGPILWSKREAALLLRNAPQGNRLEVTGLLPPSLARSQNRLQVECNGVALGKVTNASRDLLSFNHSFVLDSSFSDILYLKFSVEETYRPCDHGVNDDTRGLGFALSQVKAWRSS